MKLKCYFEFPTGMTTEDVKSDNTSYGNCNIMGQITSLELYRSLKNKYVDIEIEPINTWETQINKSMEQKYHTAWFIIENPENKKYVAINLQCDRVRNIKDWDLENCVQLFSAVGNQTNDFTYDLDVEIPYTPSTFTTWYKSGYDTIEEIYKTNSNRLIPENPIFVGGSYLFREWLYNYDTRFDMRPDRMDAHLFMQELGKYAINIDINSVAEISCRTLDIMGLGSALLRPRLRIQYHNPLIPDYHYAEVYCDDLSNYKLLANAYIDRFEELKKNTDLIKFLSENGRNWYEENATIESYVNIHMKMVDLLLLQ
jgi:hypothetical protein